MCWKLSEEVGTGYYWTYGQDDLFDIRIHDFAFHEDTFLEFRFPELLNISWYTSCLLYTSFTFEIKGGQEEAHKFIDSLDIFSLLANVADVKSLVIHPATTTHSQLTKEELEDQGIKENTIRLSIGTEHADDIIEALEQAFAQIK